MIDIIYERLEESEGRGQGGALGCAGVKLTPQCRMNTSIGKAGADPPRVGQSERVPREEVTLT